MSTTIKLNEGEIRQFRKVAKVLDRFKREPAKLIKILQAVQEEYRYLPEPVLSYVATELGIPRARVFGVATFYAHFSLEPKGKHLIKVCDGTACHVNKSKALVEFLYKRLGLNANKGTTDDMLFTVEKVSCLGACGLAPVVVIDDKVHGAMDPDKTEKVLKELINEEKEDE